MAGWGLLFWVAVMVADPGAAFARTAVCGEVPAAVPGTVEFAPAPEAWVGEDKARHFLMSFGITTLGYGVARTVGANASTAAMAAAAGSVVAGLGKEVRDVRAGGPFSLRDLVWDAAGLAVGLLVVSNIR